MGEGVPLVRAALLCCERGVAGEEGSDGGLVGIYTDPRHLIEYSDGEVRQQFNIRFRGRLINGALRGSAESTDVRWVAPAELDRLAIHHTTRLRLQHFLEKRAAPYIG